MASLAVKFCMVLFFVMVTVTQNIRHSDCSCFRTNGSSAGYFASHRFYDFRNVEGALLTVPPVIANATGTTSASFTSKFLASDALAQDWEIQNWNNSDTLGFDGGDDQVLMINSLNNVYIEPSDDDHPDYNTYLTLRTARQANFQSAAEIISLQANFHHLSARFLARVVGSPGACAGMFTYLAGNSPDLVQEADIEILTSDPRNAVQFTNQPSYQDGDVVPKATQNRTLPGKKDWTKWHVYRLDWMPGMTTWYVNNIKVAENGFQAPREPSRLMLNMWSDGGSWTGNMRLYEQAYLQIQWIEIAYNTSGPYGGTGKAEEKGMRWGALLGGRKDAPGCDAVCGIDELVNVTGIPQMLYKSAGIPMVGKEGLVKGLRWIFVLLSGAVFAGI